MTTRFAQVLIGPAGSGKSTYISKALKHYETIHRVVHCVNLDPAAENLPYLPEIDIRDVINYQDVMTKMKYGPNGALIYCLERITGKTSKWFNEAIGEHEYDYLLIDMPGQIELYSHMQILPELMSVLQGKNYNILLVYLMDSQFMSDPAKFLSASLVALSTMTMLELPHINVMSKCDLLTEEQKKNIDIYTEMECMALADEIKPGSNSKLEKLTNSICEVIDFFRLVQWRTLDSTNETELINLLAEIDTIIQYYDSADYGNEEFNEVGDEEFNFDEKQFFKENNV
ncbi:ATP binding protein [Tritrichomonas foetus]|uniref:GPN-loop GTPase 3 n=1 Tax=Tritrichomonas foetus TaxID=1144522 RepID=A0A1J4KBA4_9EUKA|nr:ATP binding protein [Tritrichomonas foetus]|eukprot:OHT06749.1 ATP binding protein [Tritrichomonas foetus]